MEDFRYYAAVLATPLKKEETGGRNFAFYESVAREIEQRGHKVFVPYKNLQKSPDPAAEAYAVIERSGVVLLDMGAPCINAATVARMASKAGIPIITFRDLQDPGTEREWDTIEFTGKEEGLPRIVDATIRRLAG